MSPNFLGIGAQRAGTGWLYRNLLKHPDIWFPPVKELHYFDKLGQYDSLSSRIRSRSWRKQCMSILLRDCLPGSRGSLAWDFRYFFGRRSDQWYVSLFAPSASQIAGEITPAYSALDREQVGHVQRLMPDVKIIYLLRNPISRVWSHAMNRMVRREKREQSSLDDERIIKFIDSKGSEIRTRYLRTIGNWEAHFSTDQIFYGFYDDVVANPGNLLTQICEFIGADPEKLQLDGSQRQQTKPKMGSRFEMPAAVKSYAARKYLDDIVLLNDRFGGHVEQWLEEATLAAKG